MSTAKESHMCERFDPHNSSYLDHMAHPHLDKNISVPCFHPYKRTASSAYPQQYASDLPNLYTGQQDAVGGLSKTSSRYCDFSYPTLRDSQCALPREIGVGDKRVDAFFTPQRRFLIFDRSENHRRLFFSPFPPQDPILASKTPATAIGSFENVATLVDPTKPIVEEKWDENHLSDGEGENEMLDDTEEINALLYSDSDDDNDNDNDDDGDENDEVSSTGHSPPFTLQEGEGYDRDKSLHETAEEVASHDQSPKRQRMLDGKYKKSFSYEDDVESRCGGDDCGIKIRQALRMLERIIPGLDKRDPLSIIDGAVEYLKSMKTEAESMGLTQSLY